MSDREKQAVLFADVCGSSALYERQGDVLAHEQIGAALRFLVEVVERHGGRVIKTIGDEVMCLFAGADDAFRAAAGMHAGLPAGMRVKTGVHCGPVLEEGGDLYGDTVNVAARVVSLSKAGEVLLTEAAVLELDSDLRRLTRKICQTTFKGMSRPLGVFGVVLEDDEMTAVAQALSASRLQAAARARMVLVFQERRYEAAAEGPPLVLGRSADCDIRVDDPRVSRRHASIEHRQGAFHLSDHSTNGTFLVPLAGEPQFLMRGSTRMPMSGCVLLGEKPDGGLEHAIEFWCGD
ncbi:MAG: adenylate/guanylate cyclase domain-containing protein [Planctomycetes bacterium]|nr:adenylate/guanylate cyclase domain-containing protein [Planctomycetota bacterium]